MLANNEFRIVTTSLKHADEVIPDWRNLLRFTSEDQPLIEVLRTALAAGGKPVVLVGRQKIADYLAAELAPLDCRVIAADYALELSEEILGKVRGEAPKDKSCTVFMCENDRLNTTKLTQLMGTAEPLTFDILSGHIDLLPDAGWTKRYEHIYPLEAMPQIEFRSGLDALILDAPARSIAQLPIGFAFVYKALKNSPIAMQAVDLDIIAYHRYHERRCLNNWASVVHQGVVHPEDPWQAVSYQFWTDSKTLDYFGAFLDEVAAKIIEAKPRVLGFSLHQTSLRFIEAITDRVMPSLPDTALVVGGMSCYQPNVAAKVFPRADYVIIGECETVVAPLFEALARGERPGDVPGVVSKYDSEKRVYVAAPLPHNLDNLGSPDYGFTDLKLYHNWNGYTLVPIVGSRGCGWSRCTFCAERFNWRARTPEMVADEIEGFTKLGFHNFVFNESDFNSNHEFVKRLARSLIERKIDIRLTAQLRISKASDQEYFDLLKQAGFCSLRFGVDGFSDRTLRLQRKGYTLETVRKNFEYCHKSGIYIEINAVIGVPGETQQDLQDSADFLISQRHYIGRVGYINALMLYVSSVYYNEPEKFNIHFNSDKEELYKKYVVSFPDDSWYSTEPFIDYAERRRRFIWLVEELRAGGVALGDFAEWTVRVHKKGKGLQHPGVVQKDDAPGVEEEEITLIPLPAEPHGKVSLINGRYYRIGAVDTETSSLEPYSNEPRLLRAYGTYNLVALNGEILAAPRSLGRVDLRDPAVRENLKVIRGKTEAEVCRIIDYVFAAQHVPDENVTPMKGPEPVKHSKPVESVRKLVRYVKNHGPVVWDRRS